MATTAPEVQTVQFPPEPEAEGVPLADVSALKVRAVPGRTRVLAGVKNLVRVLLNIKAPTAESEGGPAGGRPRRPPLKVACVLDCSYSMGGQKLQFAKRAALKLVKHLDENDTLHFISYADRAKVVFRDGDLSEPGKEALRGEVLGVWTHGQTNLFAGLEAAVAALKGQPWDEARQRNKSDDDDGNLSGGSDVSDDDDEEEGGQPRQPPQKKKKQEQQQQQQEQEQEQQQEQQEQEDTAVRRIFLFSDGMVNKGLTDGLEIRKRVARWAEEEKITTSTFGIGSDFDEPLMRGLAEAGKGRYAFLATAPEIPKLVSKSVHELLELYAAEATLEVQGGAHTCVARVYGAGGDEEEDEEQALGGGGELLVPGLLPLGDLHHNSERKVLVELEVAPPGLTLGPGGCGGAGAGGTSISSFPAGSWALRFQRCGAPAEIRGEIQLQACADRSALGEEATSVRAAFAIQRAAKLDSEVARYLASGQRQRAREAKTRQIALLQEALEAVRRELPPTGHDEEAAAAALAEAGEEGRPEEPEAEEPGTNADDDDDDMMLPGSSASSAKADAEILERVLLRAQRVQVQLEEERVDAEVVRRQCVQEMELNRAMSEAGWRSGCDSDDECEDVANLRDLQGLTPPSSPSSRSPSSRGSSPRSLRGAPDSPRPRLLLRSNSGDNSPRTIRLGDDEDEDEVPAERWEGINGGAAGVAGGGGAAAAAETISAQILVAREPEPKPKTTAELARQLLRGAWDWGARLAGTGGGR